MRRPPRRRGGRRAADGGRADRRRALEESAAGRGHRGVSASLAEAAAQAALVHQWAYRASPSAN
eukprot:4024101-Pyramimonas_sp.AAC.1